MADWISERVMSYTIVSSVPHGLSVTITLRIVVLFSCFNKTHYMRIFHVHVCQTYLHEEDVFVAIVS